MTELMQAHRQWMSRAPDERFTSLLDMQDFKRQIRDNSQTKVLSSRKLQVVPLDGDTSHTGLQVVGPNGNPAAMTHWSFGQLCSLASPGESPASYFRKTNMPAEIIADSLSCNLLRRSVEEIGVLLTRGAEVSELRSVNGPNYGRVYDAEIVDALVDRFGDGVLGQWRVPGEFGKAVTVTKDNTTLFASDRDMFVFLADEQNRIELPGRRAGQSRSFARGFFVWKSRSMHEGSMTNKNDDRSLTFELQADKDYTYVVAAEGKAHGADWRINEPEHGYLTPAKLLAMTAIDLLHGDAGPAKQILPGFEPAMTKDAYLAFQRGLFRKERSAYTEE